MHATALFADRHSTHAAIEQLAQAGFARHELSIAMSEDTHEREFGPSSPTRSGVRLAPYSGVLGAIVSNLAVFAAPGATALRVGGPLTGILLRAGALSLGLLAAGMEDQEVRAVHDGLVRGDIVVGVHAHHDRAGLATQLLKLSGGEAVRTA